MKLKDNSKLQRRIRLLKNCSTVRMLELTAKKDKYLKKMYAASKPSSRNKYFHIVKNANQGLRDFEAFSEILKKPNSLEEIEDFMYDINKSTVFSNFIDYVSEKPETLVNYVFKKRAEHIAEEYQLFQGDNSKQFSNQLAQTFNIDQVAFSLNNDMKKHVYNGLIKGTVATLASAAVGGMIYLSNPKEPEIPTPTPSEETQNDNDGKEKFVPPISNNSIDTYDDMYDDFFQKTAEIYKYKTGEDIDFSGFGKENIGHDTTSIFTVKYNGKTYRFSAKSEHHHNYKFLQKALQSVPGAEITVSSDEEITYIHDGNTSLAIIDSEGNPVKSGNVLTSSGRYELYNQDYVQKGNSLTDSNDEATKVGFYILSDQYNIQNEDLATKALVETKELAKFIKQHSMYESDATLILYEKTSDPIAEKINNEAKIEFDAQQAAQKISNQENKVQDKDDDMIK